ncbi:efflux transporter outer membrane subunit [Ramlibacter sp. H39-3-26]|uniref:efflux transporter outer membrane subunit n=1 Tax=Curvibacter soli TaxID=3031331 RepID=UPI0023DCE4FF|nr:efflux transporter outer membrane subunit [Ramlibacter sp. H39-3-26]MDF1483977.1 efflux transporter outer membrane subunit [Ramlibacter sp. H39-3-26]
MKPTTCRLRCAATALAAAACAAILSTGCADMSGIAPQAQLRESATLGLDGPPGDVQAQWWSGFGDAQLDRLVEQALAGSPSLQLAQARLERARAMGEAAGAALRPQVDGSFDVTHQRFSATSMYPPPLGGSIEDVGSLQLSAGWELDFFGKNRAALDAALGAAQAAQADAQAARVLLASSVVRGYVQWARINGQLAVARRTLAQREETLRLVRDRVNAGLDTRMELRQSQGSLPEARQQIEALQEQDTLARNAIAALVAEPKVTQTLEVPALAAMKNIASQAAIPVDLLGRRADIAAARWRVQAATRDVDVARAQFYPNISLGAFIGLSSLGMGQLLQSDSRQWGVGPAIHLPIFEGGRLRANLRGMSADLDAAVASYNAAVLDAVHEAADQIASTQSIARQQTQQRAAQQAAEDAYAIALERYQAGLGNYLQVLNAESSVLAQRRQAVDLAARALDAQAALARALGGGYAPAPGDVVAQQHP